MTLNLDPYQEECREVWPVPLIGLIGKKQSGKDTAVQELLESGWIRIGFADKLKGLAYASDPFVEYDGGHHRLSNLVDSQGWDEAKQSEDVRRYLQRLGSDGVREVVGVDVWADLATQDILLNLREGSRVVLTDVRFQNEARRIRQLGGTLIRIVRPDPGAGEGGEEEEHISETEQDLIEADVTIMNDGSIEDLQNNTHNVINMLFGAI